MRPWGKKYTPEWFAEEGARGGKLRARNLTAKRRRAIAKKAAAARWSKKRPHKGRKP